MFTLWCIFLHINCHLGLGKCGWVVIYVFDFYIKSKFPVQRLVGLFVIDVKLDLWIETWKVISYSQKCTQCNIGTI